MNISEVIENKIRRYKEDKTGDVDILHDFHEFMKRLKRKHQRWNEENDAFNSTIDILADLGGKTVLDKLSEVAVFAQKWKLLETSDRWLEEMVSKGRKWYICYTPKVTLDGESVSIPQGQDSEKGKRA